MTSGLSPHGPTAANASQAAPTAKYDLDLCVTDRGCCRRAPIMTVVRGG